MPNIKYNDILKKTQDQHWIRRQLVDSAREIGIKKTARLYSCSKNTVKHWLKVYKENPRKQLVSKSTRPKKSPNAMDHYWLNTIIATCDEFKEKNKRLNAVKLKKLKQIPFSIKTIRKKMIENGYAKINKKKHQRKKDLWQIKKKYKAFSKIQIDVKYLDDIPEFYQEYKKHRLPRYQYTARCVKTGALYVSYAQQFNVNNSVTFLHYLIKHFKKYKIPIKNNIIQTDNGVEFTQGWNKREIGEFEKAIKNYGMRYHRIPPGASTYNSDVETSHRLIEDELYSFETFNSWNQFFRKCYHYQKHFNLSRINTHKDNKTPLDILKGDLPEIKKDVLSLKPKLLDNMFFDVRIGKVA